MSFAIFGPGETSADIDHEGEQIFDWATRLGLDTPQLDWVWGRFYSHFKFTSAAQIAQFRLEVQQVRDGYRTHRREALQRERQVRVKEPEVLESILAGMMAGDHVIETCDSVIAVCDAALAEGTMLECWGD